MSQEEPIKSSQAGRQDTRALFRSLNEAREEAVRHQRDTTILFSDLVDSTSYKVIRGPIDGLARTYIHNEIITWAIQNNGGNVVKYIGDEVMATFDGTDGPQKALETAIRARSQGSNPWQTQVMALGVSRSSRIFPWIWFPLSGIKRSSV